MSDENIDLSVRGGPLFVPLIGQDDVEGIVARLWRIVGPYGQRFRLGTSPLVMESISLETFLQELDPKKEGRVDFKLIDGFFLEMTIGPRLGGYYSLLLQLQRSFFDDNPAGIPYMTQEEYLKRTLEFERYWYRLCELVGADYALFGSQPLYAQEFWRNDFAAAALDPPDVPYLVKGADERFWLTYIGSHLASQVTLEMLECLEYAKWKRLPSGALFLRGNLSPLLSGDDDYYAMEL